MTPPLSRDLRSPCGLPAARLTRVVGVFPNRASCERLIGALLLERHEKWQLETRPYCSMENADWEALEPLAAETGRQAA